MISTSYNGNKLLRSSGISVDFTAHQVQEWIKCRDDPIYFVSNYVKIVTLDYGLQPMNPYEFQKEIILKALTCKNVIVKTSRQNGKSTTCAAFLCHYIIFNDNKTCAILANKAATAREILGRVQLVYENLPKWLQHGVTEWNKGSFVLENGSRILASATSSSAIRGFSINCVAGETEIAVRHKKTGAIKIANIEDVFNELAQNAAIEHHKDVLSNTSYDILAPGGWSDFEGIRQSINSCLRFAFDDGTVFECTNDHRILVDGVWTFAKDLKSADLISNKRISHITPTEEKFVYDPVNVEKENRYFSNNLISHNCAVMDEYAFISPSLADEFFTSVYPTLSSGKDSKLIVVSTPNGMNHFYKMWQEAVDGINGFEYVSADWRAVPWRDDKWANEQRRVLGEQKFSQEMECVVGNTLITVRDKVTGEIQTIPIEDIANLME